MPVETASKINHRSIADFRIERDKVGSKMVGEGIYERLSKAADNAIAINFDLNILIDELARPATGAGSLDGVPFAVKDNIDCLPFATTGGSPALLDYFPGTDAPPVARLRDAGARPVMKLNLHELAFGVTSNNAHFGPVRNPYDHARVAGGSSGGNAAAIALGIVPFALGTDTGGSVRIPAAFCGIVGFRPSTGRYPNGGVLTLSYTRDTIGAMASCVDDIATVDSAITMDADTALPARVIRVGLLTNRHRGLSSAVDLAIEKAIALLGAASALEFVEIDMDDLWHDSSELENPLVFNEAFDFWTTFAREKLGLTLAELAERLGSPDVRAVFAAIPSIAEATRDAFDEAIRSSRAALQEKYGARLDKSGVDITLTAAVCVQPPLVGEDENLTADGIVHPLFQTLVLNASFATVLGAPSLVIPAGYDADGLPVSLQIEGRIGEDRLVLAVGELLESLLDP